MHALAQEAILMSSIRVFAALVVFLVTAACSGCVSPSRTIIRTPDAPTSPFYSQAVKVGSTLYVTGIASRDPKTNQPVGTTIQEQTRYALNSCRNILKAAGTDLNNVVEVQVLLARPDDFAGLNEEYAKFFKTDPPIRSVARLGPETPGVLVSIKMIAVVP